MGQHYCIVNIDKKQFLLPHKFGDGLKLMEFGNSACGTLCGLSVLLASGNGRGGGDIHSENELVGSWAGDRIVITGDYDDEGKFITEEIANFAKAYSKAYPSTSDDIDLSDPTKYNLYDIAGVCFQDISDDIINVIREAEGERHPLSKMDMAADGWRQRGDWT